MHGVWMGGSQVSWVDGRKKFVLAEEVNTWFGHWLGGVSVQYHKNQDFDLIFDLAIVILTFEILSGLYPISQEL